MSETIVQCLRRLDREACGLVRRRVKPTAILCDRDQEMNFRRDVGAPSSGLIEAVLVDGRYQVRVINLPVYASAEHSGPPIVVGAKD